jgi:hypothetical protein
MHFLQIQDFILLSSGIKTLSSIGTFILLHQQLLFGIFASHKLSSPQKGHIFEFVKLSAF